MQAKSLYAFLIRLINIGMGNDFDIAIFSKNSVGIGTGDRENRQIAVSVSRYSYKVSLTTLYRSHSIGSNIFVTITIYWVSMYRDCRNLDNFFSDNFFYFIRKEPASSRSIMQQKRKEWLLKLIFGMIHGTAAGRGTESPWTSGKSIVTSSSVVFKSTTQFVFPSQVLWLQQICETSSSLKD